MGKRFLARRIFAISLTAAGTAFLMGGTAMAGDPCDLLPTSAAKLEWVPSHTDVLCNINCANWPKQVSKPNAPVPSGAVPGFRYTDSAHSACSFPSNVCKTNTVCPPGTSKVSVGGVNKCQTRTLQSTTFNPRQDCKNNVAPPPFGIDRLDGPQPAVPVSSLCPETGGTTFRVRGTNVALADAVFVTQGPGARAVILAPDTSCLGTNCLRVWIDVEPTAALGQRMLEVSLWGGRVKKEQPFTILPPRYNQCPAKPKPATGTSSSTNNGPTSSGVLLRTGPAMTGRRYCEGRRFKGVSTRMTLTQVTELAPSFVPNDDGCPDDLPRPNGSSYSVRNVGSNGAGMSLGTSTRSIRLPAGTWEFFLEGDTPLGKYELR
ncbi:MAG: hypothetical protein R3B13_20210 [Polyangiaceae bacterium]